MVPHFAVVATIGTWINFRLQILCLGNFPVLILKLGLIFSFAFACADAVAVTVQYGFPWCVKAAGSSSFDAAVFQRFVALPDNSDLLCLPPSVRKAMGQRFYVLRECLA